MQGEEGTPVATARDSANCSATQPSQSVRSRPLRTVRRRIAAGLLVVAAGGAGVAHADLSQPPVAGGTASGAGCAAPVKAAEQVTIYAGKQPAYVDLKTEITVKQSSGVARDLLALSALASPYGDPTFQCYFGDFFNAPIFVSASKGLVTFSDEVSGQHILGELLSPGNGWSGSLHGRTIALSFSSTAFCNTPRDPYAADWGGTPLTLAVDSSVSPSGLSPLPDDHSGNSYTWSFPRLSCKTPSRLKVSVPVSFPTFLATTVSSWTAFGGLGFFLSGWCSQIILLLFATFFWLRYRRAYASAYFGTGRGFFLIAVTALGFVGVAANSLPNGPLSAAAWLLGVYGLFFALSLTRPPRDRVLIGAAAVSLAAFLLWVSYSGALGVDAFTLPALTVAFLVESTAAALAVAGGLYAVRRLRHIASDLLGSGADGRLAAGLDIGIFCAGTAILAAVAYSAGNAQAPLSFTNYGFSEIDTLQYCIPAFSAVLIATALIIPFLPGAPPAGRRRLWYGLLGFAALAQLPDPAIGDAVIPVAEVVFALVLAGMLAAEAPALDSSLVPGKLRAGTPCDDPLDNFRLALKISACLAILPVAYFAVTAIGSIPQDSASAIFVVTGILSQLAGWLAAGVIFSIVNTRLPGRYGPIRAIIFCGLWFAVGFAFSRVQGWLDPESGGRSWTFFGLQLLLFLVAFSAIWDARILDARLSWASLDRLREAYNLQQARSLALYAIPVLLAIIALGQQVASGSGVEFVKSALSVVPAVFGG